MRALIIENPGEHPATLIGPQYQDYVNRRGHECDVAEKVLQAWRKIHDRKYDLIMLHHFDEPDIRFLRTKFPTERFYGYSGSYGAKNGRKATIEKFDKALESLYDGMIVSPSDLMQRLVG